MPAGDLPPWCRVRMMAHLLSAQRVQGSDSAAGDTWLWLHPAVGLAPRCRALVLAGHGVGPSRSLE